MDDTLAGDKIEDLRQLVDSNLAKIIEEQSVLYGEVAKCAGDVLLAGGKRLRPILILLAYEIAGGKEIEEIMPMALAAEFIHTATLVHDDINDGADSRRGIPTLHSTHGQAKGIIGGDWLFSQGFYLGGRYDAAIVEILSGYCCDLACAEFSQLDHVMDLGTSPENYLDIVRGKTAGPFRAGCEAAAIVAGSSVENSKSLARFGQELGIAFQLVDDLLDILGDDRMGKPRGADIYEGKMTLPLIHALTLLHGEKRERLAELIVDFNDNSFEELIQLLDSSQSIQYAEILVKAHLERAMAEIESFPDCTAKQLLKHVVQMVPNRHS